MPTHVEVLEFSKELAKCLGYEIADESEISRVVLLSKDGKIPFEKDSQIKTKT